MKIIFTTVVAASICCSALAAPKAKKGTSGSALDTPLTALGTGMDKKDIESQVEVFLGSVRTRAEERGIALALDYGKKLAGMANKAFDIRNVDISGKHPVFFKMTPDFHLNTGDKDAFDGVVAKIKANWVIYPGIIEVPVPGASKPIKMPDPDGLFHVLTVAGGVETDGRFKTVNGLIELGWEPEIIPPVGGWQLYGGVFAQGGYKFKGDGAGTAVPAGKTAGDIDQSMEKDGDALARLKATAEIKSPEWNIGILDSKLRLIASGTVWYDMINSEVYHNVKGVARFTLDAKRHFDLKYEHGSGAPNFNEGDQFSAGLALLF